MFKKNMAKSHKSCMEQTEIIDTFGTYQGPAYSAPQLVPMKAEVKTEVKTDPGTPPWAPDARWRRHHRRILLSLASALRPPLSLWREVKEGGRRASAAPAGRRRGGGV